MRLFKFYYPMNEGIKEKYDEINYRMLEELYCLDSEEEFSAELFWVKLNSAGKERCSNYRDCKSAALNLFLHDIKNHTGYLRTRLYSEFEMTIRNDALARMTPKEAEEGLGTRERWIMCCEDMIRGLAQYSPDQVVEDAYCYEGYTKDDINFRFCLPKEIPVRLFSKADLDFIRETELTEKYRFPLKDLGGAVIFRYVLVPYYYALARFNPENEDDRVLKNYFVGLG